MRRISIVLVGLIAWSAAAAVQAEVSIAYVSTQRTLEQAPQAKAAGERLQQEFAPREGSIANAQKSLKGLQDRLARDGAIMSEADRGKLERNNAVQQRDLKRTQAEYNEDLNLRRNEEFSKFQREATETIRSIAQENGYDLVLEAGVIYASDKIDITDKVLARLREQFNQAQKGRK